GIGKQQFGALGTAVGNNRAWLLAVLYPIDHGADHLVRGILGTGAAAAVGHAGDAVVLGEFIDFGNTTGFFSHIVVILIHFGVETAGVADAVPENDLAAAIPEFVEVGLERHTELNFALACLPGVQVGLVGQVDVFQHIDAGTHIDVGHGADDHLT